MTVRFKRVYEDPERSDGFRVLVDRLWPRGLSKERAAVDVWLKDVAPSAELRTEWHQHSDRSHEFVGRYHSELEQNASAVEELRRLIAEHGTVTLLFASKNPDVNHARVLLDYLGERWTGER
ncbi:DUF488 domain-containing protein [Ruicaihuangia caeni]|uniref:DUF488 domain-containing protein n=1 Tax=Ruicaihuangia caeni TaxID=3042517 RepID=UPI00338E26F6